MLLRVEFKPRDMWIGVYWKREDLPGFQGLSKICYCRSSIEIPFNFWTKYDLWVCLLPMFPIHLSWDSPKWHKTKQGGKY